MIRLILTLSCLLLLINASWAQEITRITKTDSSKIETFLFYYTKGSKIIYTSKLVEEYYNGKNLKKITSFYEDTTTINYQEYKTNNENTAIGITRLYNKDGTLKMTIDEDKPDWYPADTTLYPNYTILKTMKLKGDSIIKSIYGERFFRHYLKWNIDESCYFNYGSSFAIEWSRDSTKGKYENPTFFNVVYDITYDDRMYNKAIQLIFDKEGHLISSHPYNDNWTIFNVGLEKIKDTTNLSLKPTKQEAIKIAYKNGLKRNTDTTKLWYGLQWEITKDSFRLVFNGHFRIILSQLIKKKKTKNKADFVYFYKIWVFNPWTGELMEKKKVHKKVHLDYFLGT